MDSTEGGVLVLGANGRFGQAAVQACRETTYDVVLMDVQMPVLDGLEATRAIRTAEAAAAEMVGGNGAAPNGSPATPTRRPGPQERQVFVACVLAVLVYLVLVYFVFVRPGVDRADHVLAVVIPAAILALSAELYPRLPAGLRASLMLVFGVIGLVTGSLSLAAIVVGRRAGAAVGAPMEIVGGLALVAIGGKILAEHL